MQSNVNMSALIHFLMQNGWDYTQLPPQLTCVSWRQLQRVWNKRVLPTYATHTDHVCLALLEEDPPAKRPRRSSDATCVYQRESPSELGRSLKRQKR